MTALSPSELKQAMAPLSQTGFSSLNLTLAEAEAGSALASDFSTWEWGRSPESGNRDDRSSR